MLGNENLAQVLLQAHPADGLQVGKGFLDCSRGCVALLDAQIGKELRLIFHG